MLGSPGAEAEHGPAHALDGRVAREHDEVAPGEAEPVLELDRLEQPPRLVQVRGRVRVRARVRARVSAWLGLR